MTDEPSKTTSPDGPTRVPGSFNRHVGLATKDWSEGFGAVTLRIGPQHGNSHGRVHGGVYATMLDSAIGHAVAFHADPTRTRRAVTIALETKFLSGATSGTLTATGRVVSVDGRVATCTGEVRHEDGTLCATGRATFMYLPGSEKPEGVPREPAQAVG